MVCKENLKLYLKKIYKNIKITWRPIFEVIDAPFLNKQTFLHKILKTYVRRLASGGQKPAESTAEVGEADEGAG